MEEDRKKGSFDEAEKRKAIQKLQDLIVQGDKVVLLGAGASKCSGLPLIADLTANALSSKALRDDSKKVLGAVQKSFEGEGISTIEDYLSELVDHLAVLDRRKARGASGSTIAISGSEFTREQISAAIEDVKKSIHDQIAIQAAVETHRRFVQCLHRPTRPGKKGSWQKVDYLLLNYDTLIEDALALERIPYADGFEGGATGWWNPQVYDKDDKYGRVFKLHGSINWREMNGEEFPRRLGPAIPQNNQMGIVIWPASTKYRETQLDPFATLMEYARRVLRPLPGRQRVLLVCGYSFSDAHIDIEIDRALRASEGNVTVIVFTYDDRPMKIVEKWHNDPDLSHQVIVFSRRGLFHGEKWLTSDADISWWKFEEVVRLLEGET